MARLEPDRQHAVRILESRKRGWIRQYNSLFETGKLYERAIIELNLKRADNGDIIRFCNGNHGAGRLDCAACDFEYTEFQGFPVQEPMAQVCPKCKAGVLHVKTIGRWDKDAEVDNNESYTKPVMYRNYLCDQCNYSAESPCL
jgi:rubrerythrin